MKEYHCFNINDTYQCLIVRNLLADCCRLPIARHIDDFHIILLVDNISPVYFMFFFNILWYLISIFNLEFTAAIDAVRTFDSSQVAGLGAP